MERASDAAPRPLGPSRLWSSPAARRRLSLAQDATLVVLSGIFVWVHGGAVLEGSWKNAPFALQQLILLVLFLTRRRSSATSPRPWDWFVAAVGGWLPLAYRPEPAGSSLAAQAGTVLQVLGVSLAALAILYLGRSFGIVAANRGLKTGGPYRLVRHPIYAAHLLSGLGFLVANASPYNGALFATVLWAQLMRIQAEERFLGTLQEYRAYMAAVRWRLLPFLY